MLCNDDLYFICELSYIRVYVSEKINCQFICKIMTAYTLKGILLKIITGSLQVHF